MIIYYLLDLFTIMVDVISLINHYAKCRVEGGSVESEGYKQVMRNDVMHVHEEFLEK